MPEVNQQSDSNRRRTRPGNANAHPGRAAMEVLAVWQKKAEIEDEKEAQDERHKARQQKKSSKQAAVLDVADFENDMAIDDKAEKMKFPRNLTEGAYLGN